MCSLYIVIIDVSLIELESPNHAKDLRSAPKSDGLIAPVGA